MKKILIAALTNIICICSFAQTQKAPEKVPECPSGTHPIMVYEFDEFNFHRPKWNCLSGFWFCFKGGKWTVECVSNMSSLPYKPVINGGYATVIAELTEKNIRYHFSSALLKTEGYTSKDLSVFNVDEALEINFGGKTVKLITGDYPVKLAKDELIIDVNYQ